MRVAAMAVLAVALATTTAHAGAAEQLGDAYRAYDAGDVDAAAALVVQIDESALVNRDYLHWLRGQVALLRGEAARALVAFQALAADKDSRFAAEVPWRIADCHWELGRKGEAAKAYAQLLGRSDAVAHADLAIVRLRIAEAKKGAAAKVALRSLLIEHPAHPAAAIAERRLGGAHLTADERIARAINLVSAHLWHEAVHELMLVPANAPPAIQTRRTYWLGETLFKMRRRYSDAGELLLSIYEQMGATSAEAMFHGARALSRADRDDEAIVWYRRVVARFPRTAYAEEAQYLSGWLEFNRGRYAEAIPGLEQTIERYPRSKWNDDALWFLAMSKYLLGRYQAALPHFERLADHGGALEGGKGRYWKARTLQQLGDEKKAQAEYTVLVARWPFSWYSLLARARLAEAGVQVGPFGKTPPAPHGPPIAAKVDESLARDPLIGAADELIAAGLTVEAGEELERGERGFLGRHDRGKALRLLLDRYARAGNHARPWMLAIVYGESALDGPAEGAARVWWEYAYPQAYRELIERWQKAGDCPPFYLYAIMRKESGFNPHDLSYADAQGLLQMIPATTAHVARVLDLPYDPGKLYDPEFNIRTGAWYIGHLLSKFKGQIPIGAGAFNSGPRPVMKWLDKNAGRPVDEFVELVSYTQTREYMKKVTENYARYVYLYEGRVYDQPLTVDKAYRVDAITY